MQMTTGFTGRETAIADLFTATFTASEGAEEGARIGAVARDLLADTPGEDIRVFCAVDAGSEVPGSEDAGEVIAAAIFSRLVYPEDRHAVFLLSPMAVAPVRQRQGIGQALIGHGLAALRAEGVQVALTYGDPAYYAQVGFRPITEAQARAPLPLSFPHGWIGQSLTGDPLPELQGSSRCVAALNRPDIW